MVQNLVVDISINQINGLSTLCFLEQVDCVIEKDHLFKRSIILIKAWCYYESRTLGAHVGLISTYGLETLVLYIFHVFHLSLNGPLSVLYKFLEYFSVFDWDNYGISLMGPVLLSELPSIVVKRLPNSDNLLLDFGFLRRCFETLSVPLRPGDVFLKKHINIVDPLNDQNNLGRSVNQGNFFRIRSAFTYGARQLSEILMNEDKNIAEELQSFFANTLEMYGINQRFDNISDNIASLSLNTRISSAKTMPSTIVTAKLRNSDDENSYLGNCPNSVNETQKQSEVLEEVVPCAGEVVPSTDASFSQSKQLDLTGDLRAYLACLDQVRRWSYYAFGPCGLMGPPPPHILMNLVRPEHAGLNGVACRPQFLPPDQMFLPRPPLIHNDSNHRINGPRHGYHTSVSHSTNDGTQNPQKFTAFVPVPLAVEPREPLLQRRRNPNPNRSRQPDGIQRPRSKSGSM
ncbi:uncharacterized protein [Rutidosis leptorrhynchoides]|uniref:uncharacterized protein isoform X2 n=1 Tax=Rutidosis leptorrhynchoides TaxID=125765 RepID=UPI003A9A08A7